MKQLILYIILLLCAFTCITIAVLTVLTAYTKSGLFFFFAPLSILIFLGTRNMYKKEAFCAASEDNVLHFLGLWKNNQP